LNLRFASAPLTPMDLFEGSASRLPTAVETRSVSYAVKKRINLVHQADQ